MVRAPQTRYVNSGERHLSESYFLQKILGHVFGISQIVQKTHDLYVTKAAKQKGENRTVPITQELSVTK